MAARRHAAPSFRPSAPATGADRPSRTQFVALLTGLVVVAAGIAIASYVVKPNKARAFDFFYGSVFLDDNTSPVAVDLASGKPTVRLAHATDAVSATQTADIDVVPLGGGNTLMLNRATGDFNMVDATGFVLKTTTGGVTLPTVPGSTTSMGLASGSSAYIVRNGTEKTSIYLVGTSTVSAASGGGSTARAYATINAPLAQVSAPAASANGGLWVLTDGGGGTSRITELAVPPHSDAGATLVATPHGTVSGIAAVAGATRNSDGTGGDVTAVASATAVRVFDGADSTSLPVSVGTGVDRILPASNGQGRLTFLYHSTSDGWTQVSVPTTGGGTAGVARLTAIDGTAALATPAESDGTTYTVDTTTETLWQIDARGQARLVPGANSYPFKDSESRGQFTPQVVARGSRVIFNNRTSAEALVVFSDGTRPPRIIDKHSAVQVDPAGATALADAHARAPTKNTGRPPKGTHQPKPQKQPTQTINNKIDCKTTTQVPHIPTLMYLQRAARSITLHWDYRLLDPTDCRPSTYVVDVETLTPGAPSAPSALRVQGTDGVTVTGLFPATTYRFTVTAYINAKGSPSRPLEVSTGPEGPAAPTDVAAVPDSSGNWTVSWTSCGGIAQGCVQSTTWNVIAAYCDGRSGLAGLPPPVSFAADPTEHTFHTTFPGNDSLLGRGLCFRVQGVSPEGTVGDISDPTPTSYSWRTPVANAFTLNASRPAATTLGGTSTTTVDLDLGSDPVRDVGGAGATITFTLTGPAGTQTKSLVYDGLSQSLHATFPGIEAGSQYTASAHIAAPRHPEAAVDTPSRTVTTRAAWPTLSLNPICPPNGTVVVLSCSLSVQINGISSAAAHGERFSTTDGSRLQCGSTSMALSRSDFDPAQSPVTAQVDLTQYYGSCTVYLGLSEASGSPQPLVFGGSLSPVVTQTVNLQQASTLDAGSGDFAVNWSATQSGYVRVKYTGNETDQQVAMTTQGWSEQVNAPNIEAACGSAAAQPTGDGILIAVDNDCIKKFGGRAGWTVTISYHDYSNGDPHSVSATLDGTPPGFVPCSVNGTFTASWDGSWDNPAVVLHYEPGGGDNLDGCDNWSYQVRHGRPCGDLTGPDPSRDVRIDVSGCQGETSLPGWTVTISWDGPDPLQQGQSRLISSFSNDPPPSPTPTPTPTPDPPPTDPPPTDPSPSPTTSTS